jgi:hypothetical protein
MHGLGTFGARMSHGQFRTHKTHHSSDLREATTFPLIVYFVPLHKGHIQMAFCPWDFHMGVLKFSHLGLPQLWGPITL